MNKVTSRKNNELSAIYKSALRFLSPLSLEQTYRVFMEEALRLVDGKYGSILLIKKGKIQRVYSSSQIFNDIQPRSRGFTYKTSMSGKYKVLKVKQIEKIHPEIKKANIQYDILVPLINKNKSIGLFSILKSQKPSKHELDLVQLFSPLGTLAIRKAQLYGDINKEVETRDLFISLASHELRTPLTTSYIYLQLIERNYLKHKPFDRNWVITLKNEMERLSTIINELLELNQIRSGKLMYSWQECNIEQILERALTSFKATYKKRIVRLNNNLSQEKTIFIGDFNKLIGVFINLLDNAAKHSEEDSEIDLNLSIDKKYIAVSVKDMGTGIPEKDLSKIFEGFYKAHGNTKSGMGLGLFLAKEIIGKHKGKISVESRSNEGTIITVKIPFVNL